MSRRRLATAAIAGAALTTAAACGGTGGEAADGDSVEIRYTSPLPENSGLMATTAEFMERVEEETDGRVAFDPYWAGSLMGGTDALPAIQNGTVDAGFLSDPYWPEYYPLWNVIGIPFETTNPDAVAKTFSEMDGENESFTTEIADSGVKNLFYIPYSPTVIGANTSIEDLDDLSGLRFRAIGHFATAFELADARPTAMDPVEVYEAMERGVVDGFGGWPFDLVPDSGFHEVSTHMADPGIGHYASASYGLSLETWESISEDDQKIMTDVASDIQENRSVELLMEQEAAACDTLKEAGVKLVKWDASEVERWAELAHDPIFEQWLTDTTQGDLDEDVAQAYYDEFHERYEDHVAASDYEDGLKACIDSM